MKTYKSLLKEAKAKSAVMVFGRFNPPTIGHGKLLESAGNVARRFNAELYVYGSQSQDPKKNPLSNQQKMNFMKEMFPKYKNSIQADPNIRSAIDAAVKLNEGNDQLVMVVGSDRVADFKKLLEQYNGRKAKHGYYEYDSIKIVSAGERDPDAEGVTGMSASKMRKAASENDVDSFRNGVPTNMSEQSMMRMLKSVRKGLNLKEAIFSTYYSDDEVISKIEWNTNFIDNKDNFLTNNSKNLISMDFLFINYSILIKH